MKTPHAVVGAIAACLSLAQSGIAQQATQSIEPANETDLHFAFTPGVYLARLGGESRFGDLPAADDISLETDFDLDDRESAPNFELAVTKGSRWQIDASLFDFSTSGSGVLGFSGAFGDVAFAPGDAYTADFDMTSFALSVSYWQWHPIDSAERGGSLDLRIAGGGGIRWLSVDQTLELPGTGVASKGDGEWLIPELLVQLDLNYRLPDSFFLLENFQVLALASIGPAIGGDGGAVVTLRAGMRFWMCECFSLDFGYRLIEAGVESEDYELVGGLQGLFLSGTIRF